ncbi:MAG TPA: DUF4397 domain-containing protein [Thermoleophilaceae bacterium]|nr:DUF4397 domain-containing protein [Thermoleophilaceae bacterium]
MRFEFSRGRWVHALIASLLMLLVGPAASAWGAANVRFVQAIPDAGGAQLFVVADDLSQRVGRGVGFGEVGPYVEVPPGEVTFEVRESGDGSVIAKVSAQLADRAHYTTVALRNGEGRLIVMREGDARPKSAQLRAVHAAPELGTVDVRLGDRIVAEGVGPGGVGDYTTVQPGAYAVNVTNPNDGSVIAARGGVPLTAGTSSTAIVIGTAGEPIDVIVAAGESAAPRGAPATGLGGLADGDSPVPLALLAALLAACGGAAAYVVLTARARRGGP